MASRYRIKQAEIDTATRTVKRGTAAARLSPKAMKVLQCLIDADGDVVSRDDLLDAAWAGSVVVEEVLTHAIAELRRSFGDDFRAPQVFQTIHKSGYRLLATPKLLENRAPVFDSQVDEINVPAYADYLKALEYFEKGGAANVKAAVRTLDKVCDQLPKFAPAHAHLSITLAFNVLYYGGNRRTLARAHEASQRALQLDDRCAAANTAVAFLRSIDGDAGDAFRHFGRAIKSDPRSMDAHKLLGRVLFTLGDFGRSALMLGRATQLMPDQYHFQLIAAKALYGAGRRVEAMSRLRSGRLDTEMHSDFAGGEMQAICDRIYFQFALGETRAAVEATEAILGKRDGQLYYPATGMARAGLIGEALDCLDACTAAGWRHREWLLNDPDLTALHAEPRFRRLITELTAAA